MRACPRIDKPDTAKFLGMPQDRIVQKIWDTGLFMGARTPTEHWPKIPRQERDILKKATAFFAREGSR